MDINTETLVPVHVGPDETREFRRRLAAGSFCVQRCLDCDSGHFPPGPGCWRCGSTRLEWLPVDDRCGRVASVTTCHRSFMAFADQVPYTVVLGELRAHPGVRVIARLQGAGTVTIGDEVELTWVAPTDDDPTGGDPPLYFWRPHRSGA